MDFKIKTKALCHTCHKIVPAEIADIGGRLYLKKFCDKDGITSIKTFNNARFFTETYAFTKRLKCISKKQKNFAMVLSGRCNMSCPVCYFDWFKDSTGDISLEKTEHFLKNRKENFALYGKEVSTRDDVVSILRLFAAHKRKIPALITNGLLFADMHYTQSLAREGLREVFFQFDGFDKEANVSLRGKDYTERKLTALENLYNAGVGISIYSLIKKDVNEHQVKKIFELARKNKFIKEVTYLSYIEFNTDKAVAIKYESRTLLFDELLLLGIKELSLGTPEKFLNFQKIFLFCLSLFGEKGCLSNAHYFVIYAGERRYLPQDVMRIRSIVSRLDNYLSDDKISFLKNNNFIKSIFLVYCLAKNLKYKAAAHIFFSFCRRKTNLIKLKFAKCCGPYDFDTQKMSTCGTGVIFSVGDKVYKKDRFALSPYYKLSKEESR